jgi:hypothetical protein
MVIPPQADRMAWTRQQGIRENPTVNSEPRCSAADERNETMFGHTHRKLGTRLLTAVLIVGGVATRLAIAGQDPQFDLTLLPEAPGDASRAHSIGPTGQDGFLPDFVAGEVRVADVWRPAVWLQSTDDYVLELLPDLGFGGQIVDSQDGALPQYDDILVGYVLKPAGKRLPAVWERADPDDPFELTVLPVLNGAEGAANSITWDTPNERPAVVGWSLDANGVKRAILWTPAEDWTLGPIPWLAPGKDAIAHGVVLLEDSGSLLVVGSAVDSNNVIQPVRWREYNDEFVVYVFPTEAGGVAHDVSLIPPDNWPFAVGWAEHPEDGQLAAMWEYDGSQWQSIELGAPEGFQNSRAAAGAWPDDWEMPWLTGDADNGPGTHVAVLWTVTDGEVEDHILNDLVVDPGSFWLSNATGFSTIESDGPIVIGGWGEMTGLGAGPPHAYLLLPHEDPCPADFDGDGQVGSADLLHLLGCWGTDCGDVDGDGTTGSADLLALLAAWGECP